LLCERAGEVLIKVEVRLFANFRKGREKKQTIQLKEGAIIRDLLEIVNIPEEEVSILLQNGKYGPADRVLNDGDIIAVFPPVGGG